jgi:hypothetical protein
MDSQKDIIAALTSMNIIMSRVNVGNDGILLSIQSNIQQYIAENCDHNIVYDYVDIPPESGMSIKFCDICMKTF